MESLVHKVNKNVRKYIGGIQISPQKDVTQTMPSN